MPLMKDRDKYQPQAKLGYLCNGIGDYSVYLHVFPNGKRYIGLTSQSLNKRWQNGTGYRGQLFMARAIKKYRWDNIQHILLCENLSKRDAEVMECTLIASYNSNNQKYGYNITCGGEAKGKHSEETRRKISENRNYLSGADHPSSKKVIQLTLDGEVVRVWDSCTIAMNEFRSEFSSSIKACCQRRAKTAYGYKWCYMNE